MQATPRVAFLTDTFDKINGVALTSRELQAYAGRQNLPFLCVCAGEADERAEFGSVTHLILKRGALSFGLDHGLLHDPVLWRHIQMLRKEIDLFRPNVIHVVSPGDVSELGAFLARLLKLPLVISWHTNLHEFGARRLQKMLASLPDGMNRALCDASEDLILAARLFS